VIYVSRYPSERAFLKTTEVGKKKHRPLVVYSSSEDASQDEGVRKSYGGRGGYKLLRGLFAQGVCFRQSDPFGGHMQLQTITGGTDVNRMENTRKGRDLRHTDQRTQSSRSDEQENQQNLSRKITGMPKGFRIQEFKFGSLGDQQKKWWTTLLRRKSF